MSSSLEKFFFFLLVCFENISGLIPVSVTGMFKNYKYWCSWQTICGARNQNGVNYTQESNLSMVLILQSLEVIFSFTTAFSFLLFYFFNNTFFFKKIWYSKQ